MSEDKKRFLKIALPSTSITAFGMIARAVVQDSPPERWLMTLVAITLMIVSLVIAGAILLRPAKGNRLSRSTKEQIGSQQVPPPSSFAQ